MSLRAGHPLKIVHLWTQLPAVLEHRALVGEIARIQAMAPPHDGGRGPASHPVWPASTGKPKCAAEASAQLLELLLRWGLYTANDASAVTAHGCLYLTKVT